MEQPRPLPTIAELYNETEAKGKQNDLNVLLNQEPHKSWIEIHPSAKGYKYVPIERKEYLMTRIFINWWTEVIEYRVMLN